MPEFQNKTCSYAIVHFGCVLEMFLAYCINLRGNFIFVELKLKVFGNDFYKEWLKQPEDHIIVPDL